MGITHEMTSNTMTYNSLSLNEYEYNSQENSVAMNASVPQEATQWLVDNNSVSIDMNFVNELPSDQQTIILLPPNNELIGSAGDAVKPVQVLVSPLPQVNVIQVPTTLLLTENVIMIPPEGITLQVPQMTISSNTMASLLSPSLPPDDNSSNEASVKRWFTDAQIAARGITAYHNNPLDEAQIARGVTFNNNPLEHVLIAVQPDDSNVSFSYPQPQGANLLQNNFYDNNDINVFLASNIASNLEQQESDPLEAKRWHTDSVIASRALIAFKKASRNAP